MRAIEPRREGPLEVAGFTLYVEEYGDEAAPPVLLLPAWQIVPSRIWKMQIPTLARHFRAITYDPPGIGKAERTADPAAFEIDRVVEYAIGVLDHLGIERASIIGLSLGGAIGLLLAARHPERVSGAVLIGTARPESPRAASPEFWNPRKTYEGWEKYNTCFWQEHFDAFLEFFFGMTCTEPHSSKVFDDMCSWASETTPEILTASVTHRATMEPVDLDAVAREVQCPVLLIHGTEDRVASIDLSRQLAASIPDVRLIEMNGSGHVPQAREPVKVNEEILTFLGQPRPRKHTWTRALGRRRRRALYVSSPIGLGHVHRDLAIARELRNLVPDLEIDWLAQSPVTTVLEAAGERIHPMSTLLASESAHWESFASDHELHCFRAFREMDEILLANFMVFLDVVRETPYDLWIGDEAWEVDHYLHENPELKTAPYVFLTDFLGWLPMDRSPGSREAWLTADYNAEMIEHVDRFPHVRDRALYIGDFDDLVPDRFGPDLPCIPEWAPEHFEATGYIVPFDPEELADTRALRLELGYDPDVPLVMFAVGGTTAGQSLLRTVVESWPLFRRQVPDAEGVIVTGPRIDPVEFSRVDGLRSTGYVHELYRHLAAVDLAVVQGGLSTTMELTATRRPFINVPLRNHCEQVFHVSHRLDRYNAGTRLEFAGLTPNLLADAMTRTLATNTSTYRPTLPGAAHRAATSIANLL